MNYQDHNIYGKTGEDGHTHYGNSTTIYLGLDFSLFKNFKKTKTVYIHPSSCHGTPNVEMESDS